MILNDIKTKVEGSFKREITIDDETGDFSDDITYVFPDTKEFISIIRRNVTRSIIFEENKPVPEVKFKLWKNLKNKIYNR